MDPISGLPLHPLIVHLPVMLLPLAALGIAFLTVRPKARRQMAMPLLMVLVVGFVGALVAKTTGEQLSPYVGGVPKQHAQFGAWLVWAAGIFLVVGGSWLWWVRKDVRVQQVARESSMKTLMGLIASLLGLGVLALTAFVGHLGASATWSKVVNPSATKLSTQPGSVTMLDVSKHNSKESCWVAIDGSAYDLTSWLPQHPGGPSHIARICGTDATETFAKKHADDERANTTLGEYLIGVLQG